MPPVPVAHEDSIRSGVVVDPPDPPLSRDLFEELAGLQVNDVEAAIDGVRHEQPAPFRVESQVVEPTDRALQLDRLYPLQGRRPLRPWRP